MAGSDWDSANFHHMICCSIIRNHFQPKKSDFEKNLFCPLAYLTVDEEEEDDDEEESEDAGQAQVGGPARHPGHSRPQRDPEEGGAGWGHAGSSASSRPGHHPSHRPRLKC